MEEGKLGASVADPDPNPDRSDPNPDRSDPNPDRSDPYVFFGPPGSGSGSINHKYGSRS